MGSWLSATKPWVAPYLPQLGDDVVYLAIGHRAFVEKVQAQPPFAENLPWDVATDLRDVEWCRVLGTRATLDPTDAHEAGGGGPAEATTGRPCERR